MITDVKTIGDMAFSTATCAVFAFPTEGPILAAGLSGAQFCFDLFFPTPSFVQDPGSLVPTIDWMKLGFKAQLQDIRDSRMEDECADKAFEVITANAELAAIWQDLYEPPDAGSPVNLERWQNRIENYFAGQSPDFARLANDKIWFEGHPSLLGKVFEVYALLGSIVILHHKLGALWDYNRAVRRYQADLDAYNAYRTAYKKWKETDREYRAPQPPDPVKEPVAINRGQFLKANLHARNLGRAAQDLVAAGSRMYELLCVGREAQVEERQGKVSLQSEGAAHWYFDSATGVKGAPQKERARAAEAMEAYLGTLEEQVWESVTRLYALSGVTGERIQQFGQTIELWKKAQNSVQEIGAFLVAESGQQQS